MAKSYMTEKSEKKKTAMKGVYGLLIISVIFISALVKYSLAGSRGTSDSAPNGLPANDDVYTVAKTFIKPAISADASFPETGYQLGNQPDSVYIIRSYYEIKSDISGGDKRSYEISIKYNGGNYTNKSNWSIVNLEL